MSIQQTVRLVVIVTTLFCLGSPLPSQAAEKLVAKVGSVPVTEYELQREQNRIMPMNATFHGGISPDKVAKIRADALQNLIDRAYKVNYALIEEIALEKGALDQRVQQIQKKYKSNREFEKATGKEGVAGVRASLYRELLALKAEQVAVAAKVTIADAEVSRFYESNKASYMRPRQFKASHILVKVDPSSNKDERDKLLKKAQDLADKAHKGEDFFNLAYYNSDDRTKFVGGDLGYFHEGQTVKEFEAALKKMQPGEISEPVKSMVGYHVIKLVEVNEPRLFTFDEVKEKIRKNLEDKMRERIYGEWMDGLKAKFVVERY